MVNAQLYGHPKVKEISIRAEKSTEAFQIVVYISS